MQFRVLGPLEVIDDAGRPLPITGGRQRALLARLLVAGGETVPAERLIESVWGDRLPADPANTLQQSVAQLRRALEPERERRAPAAVLVREGNGYRLDLDGHHVDADRFAAEVAEGRAALASGEDACAPLFAAMECWRGPAYVDVAYGDFARPEIERLEEARLEARELLTDAVAARDGSAAVVADLEGIVAEHPSREGAWGRLMTALYRSGRQGDALEAYQRARHHLNEELGIDPSPALRELEERILRQDEGLDASEAATPAPGPSAGGLPASDAALAGRETPPGNLPSPPTSFVGRDAELELIGELLGRERIVTLTGPGGSGKTRLAIEAGHAAGAGFDSVHLVRLDGLRDPALLVSTVATAVGMPENPELAVVETLAAYLAPRRTLVILDNCEHLIEVVAELAEAIAERCPRTVVLATSQTALNIAGEQLVPVPPLDLPGDSGSPFEALEAVPAVQLFLDRATRLVPDLETDADSLAAIANVVRALDGIPLAIELAAARTRLLSPSEIAERLADRFELLDGGSRTAPARQRTLRGAVEWSYSLLSEEERAFFDELGLFAGGFDLDAAAAVAAGGDPGLALQRLGSLQEKSLLWSGPVAGRRRFGLLETLRAFALERLEERDGVASARARHAGYYAALTEELNLKLHGAAQTESIGRFASESDNLRSAMSWSIESGELMHAARIASSTGEFWDWSGSLAEANEWLGRVLTAADGRTVDPPLGTAAGWAAYFATELGEMEEAQALAAESLRIAVANEDPFDAGCAHSMMSYTARVSGDLETAARYAAEMRSSGSLVGETWWIAWADNHDSIIALESGDLDRAESSAHASLAAFEEIGDRRGVGWALTACAQVSHARGAYDDARERALAAAELSTEVGDGRNASWAFEIAADASRAAGDGERAAELLGAATTLREVRGAARSPWRGDRDGVLRDQLEALLGAEFSAAWERGQSLAASS